MAEHESSLSSGTARERLENENVSKRKRTIDEEDEIIEDDEFGEEEEEEEEEPTSGFQGESSLPGGDDGSAVDINQKKPIKKKRKYKPRVRKHPVPFLSRLVQMFTEEPQLIRWSQGNIIIPDPKGLEKRLPIYFRHGNYNSFLRQLNNFGYNKVETCHGICTVYVKVQGEQVHDIAGLLALRPRERKTERQGTNTRGVIFSTEEAQNAVDIAVAAALPQNNFQSAEQQHEQPLQYHDQKSKNKIANVDTWFVRQQKEIAAAPLPQSPQSISGAHMINFQMPQNDIQYRFQQNPAAKASMFLPTPSIVTPSNATAPVSTTGISFAAKAPAPSKRANTGTEQNCISGTTDDSRMPEVEALLALRPRGTSVTTIEQARHKEQVVEEIVPSQQEPKKKNQELQVKIKRHEVGNITSDVPPLSVPGISIKQQHPFYKLHSSGVLRPPPIDISDSNAIQPQMSSHEAMLVEELKVMHFKLAALEHEKYLAQAQLEAMRSVFHGFRHCISCRMPQHQAIFGSCGHFVCCHRCAATIINQNNDASCPICKQNIGMLIHPPQLISPALMALQQNTLRFPPPLSSRVQHNTTIHTAAPAPASSSCNR